MTKVVVIIGFCVAFAAGLTVGLSRQAQVEQPTAPAAPTSRPSHRGGFLAELKLTPEQQEKMKQIWEPSRGGREDHEKRRRELRDKRDAAIEALIPAQQKQQYEQALADYRAGLDTLDEEMRDGFRKKVAATTQLLTPEQRTKYEDLLSRREWGRDGRGGPDRDRDKPTTTRRSDSAQTHN
jgi:Spy/CpxP family protein refolding chaperone